MKQPTLTCYYCGFEQKSKTADRYWLESEGWVRFYTRYTRDGLEYWYCPKCAKRLKNFMADMETRELKFMEEKQNKQLSLDDAMELHKEWAKRRK